MPREVYNTTLGNITLYTQAEVAELHGIAEDMVMLYIKTGEIKARKFGSDWYLPDKQLSKDDERAKKEPAAPEGEPTMREFFGSIATVGAEKTMGLISFIKRRIASRK